MIGGMFFAAKAALTMNEEFGYDLNKCMKPQKTIFRGICDEVRANGGNRTDAACYFMLVTINSLNDLEQNKSLVWRWLLKARELEASMTEGYASELAEIRSTISERLA